MATAPLPSTDQPVVQEFTAGRPGWGVHHRRKGWWPGSSASAGPARWAHDPRGGELDARGLAAASLRATGPLAVMAGPGAAHRPGGWGRCGLPSSELRSGCHGPGITVEGGAGPEVADHGDAHAPGDGGGCTVADGGAQSWMAVIEGHQPACRARP